MFGRSFVTLRYPPVRFALGGLLQYLSSIVRMRLILLGGFFVILRYPSVRYRWVGGFLRWFLKELFVSTFAADFISFHYVYIPTGLN